MCLEFSKIDNELLNYLYKQYSKQIFIGKLVVGSEKPYEYLVNSIEKFYNQEQLVELMKTNGFSNIEFRNVLVVFQQYIRVGKSKCSKEF